MLARLSVFRGGCDRTAAQEVAGATLPVLAALVDKSLIRRASTADGTARYDLHELLRQYAQAKLEADADEDARTRDRHTAYYARQLGERTVPFLNGAAPVAMAEVAPDLDNIRLAWARAVAQRDHHLLGQMAHSMQVICEVRGLFEEGVALFGDAASGAESSAGETRATMMREASWSGRSATSSACMAIAPRGVAISARRVTCCTRRTRCWKRAATGCSTVAR